MRASSSLHWPSGPLRMRAASLNYRDFVMAQRGYGRRSGTLPLVPLSDGAGEVVALGPGVSRVSLGDLVCPIFGQTWLSGPIRDDLWAGMLGGPRDGVMQELMVLSEEGVVRAPRHLTPVQAAATGEDGRSAYGDESTEHFSLEAPVIPFSV